MVREQAGAGGTLAKLDKLTSAQDTLSERLKDLEAEALRMARKQELFAENSSNQIANLHLTADRELSLMVQIEQHRAMNDKMAADYGAMSTNYDKLLTQIALMTNPPSAINMPPGIT